MEQALSDLHVELVAVEENLVDKVWHDKIEGQKQKVNRTYDSRFSFTTSSTRVVRAKRSSGN
jgi:hypothetical protein